TPDGHCTFETSLWRKSGLEYSSFQVLLRYCQGRSWLSGCEKLDQKSAYSIFSNIRAVGAEACKFCGNESGEQFRGGASAYPRPAPAPTQTRRPKCQETRRVPQGRVRRIRSGFLPLVLKMP
ncbi:unnamed protein product, partial [Ectocarpus sp. 12 AP-2014]